MGYTLGFFRIKPKYTLNSGLIQERKVGLRFTVELAIATEFRCQSQSLEVKKRDKLKEVF